MTTLAEVKRVIAQLSPEQRAQLEALVASQQPVPETALTSDANEPVKVPSAEPPQPRLSRPTRDLVGTWQPLPTRPKQYDPLEMWR